MRLSLVRTIAAVVACLGVGAPALAQRDLDLTRDLPGAADHPLVPRAAGAVIFGFKADGVATARVPLGPAFRSHNPERRGFEKTETVVGARTRLLYLMPRQRPAGDAIRHYVATLAAKGFATAWECARDSCGVQIDEAIYGFGAERRIADSRVMEYAFSLGVEDPRLWVGRLDRPQGPLWVAVFAAYQGNAANGEAGNRVAVLVDILDKGAADPATTIVPAREIALALARDGRQAVPAIVFDPDTAVPRPASTPQLGEIATLLREEPSLGLYIVGHSDGEAGAALALRRAEAVVEALVARHGVAPTRLTARGLGPYAPLATNDTEAGRAKNRRLELVKR